MDVSQNLTTAINLTLITEVLSFGVVYFKHLHVYRNCKPTNAVQHDSALLHSTKIHRPWFNASFPSVQQTHKLEWWSFKNKGEDADEGKFFINCPRLIFFLFPAKGQM